MLGTAKGYIYSADTVEKSCDLTPIVETFHDSISIKFITNIEGNTQGYIVWYRPLKTYILKRVFPANMQCSICNITNLSPGHQYIIYVIMCTEGKKETVTKWQVSTRFCSPPVKFEVIKNKNKLCLRWSPPNITIPEMKISGYTLKWENYLNCNDVSTVFENADITEVNLHISITDGNRQKRDMDDDWIGDNSSCVFHVHAHCEKLTSREVTTVYILPKHELLKQSKKITNTVHAEYHLDTSKCQTRRFVSNVDLSCSLDEKIGDHREKVVLLISTPGAGKETWINAIINNIMGVRYDDNFRFKIIPDGSGDMNHGENPASSNVEIYRIKQICGLKIDFALTIVDIAGLNEYNNIPLDLISEHFQTNLPYVHAIVFITPSASKMLTFTQKCISDHLKSIFSQQKISDNVYVFSTFADTKSPRERTSVVTELGIDDNHFIPFNNSAFFDDASFADPHEKSKGIHVNGEQDFAQDELSWNLGNEQLNWFLDRLGDTHAMKLSWIYNRNGFGSWNDTIIYTQCEICSLHIQL